MRGQRRFGAAVLGPVVAVMILAKGGAARADIITPVSLSGEPPISFVADVLTLNGGSIPSLTLPFGVPVTTNTQTVSFLEGDSGATDQLFPFTFTENVTIGGVTHTITQSGELLISPPGDTFTLFPGTTTAFNLGALGTVLFTPLSAGPIFQPFTGNGIPETIQLQGTFVAAPPPTVPEPSSLALLSLGGLALAGWRRWKKRATV